MSLLRQKKRLSEQKDMWFYFMIVLPFYSFLMSYGLCSVSKLSVEITLSWISAAFLFSMAFASLGWNKIQKISQRIAEIDKLIAEGLAKI